MGGGEGVLIRGGGGAVLFEVWSVGEAFIRRGALIQGGHQFEDLW